MDNADLLVQAEQWAHLILEWVGFGTVVGLLAKAIMPGRDPGGALVTLAMGIGGTIIGLGVVSYFYHGQHLTPISPLGVLVATGGAFLLLFFYRLMAGRWIREGESSQRIRVARPRILRRRDAPEYEEMRD